MSSSWGPGQLTLIGWKFIHPVGGNHLGPAHLLQIATGCYLSTSLTEKYLASTGCRGYISQEINRISTVGRKPGISWLFQNIFNSNLKAVCSSDIYLHLAWEIAESHGGEASLINVGW